MDVCTAKQGQHRIAHAYPRPFYSLYLQLWCPHPPLFYSCLGSTSISRAPPRPKSYTEGSRSQSTLAWREGRDAHLTARGRVHFPVSPSIFQHSGMMRSVRTWALQVRAVCGGGVHRPRGEPRTSRQALWNAYTTLGVRFARRVRRRSRLRLKPSRLGTSESQHTDRIQANTRYG